MSDRAGDGQGVYVRPQWTGKPAHYSDGTDDYEFSECPSCLAFHHANNKSCNGKREPCDSQCEAALGEIRCHRPANHTAEHQALSSVMRVAWSVLSADESRAPDDSNGPDFAKDERGA